MGDAVSFLGAIEIVGGLAGAVNSFEFESERVRTAEGLWFNRNTRWKLQSRQLLARIGDAAQPRNGPPQLAALFHT